MVTTGDAIVQEIWGHGPKAPGPCAIRLFGATGDLSRRLLTPCTISQTETYVAMKMVGDNWRWAGVPFYVRTGKRLTRRNTHMVVQFRNAPLTLFRRSCVTAPHPNSLVSRHSAG
jgi:glucose-6-phosphate 1-dehydrogenase